MDGEIIDALFGLFDQRVAIDFPGEIFGDAVHLFQRLVDRHGADRYGAVAQDPFAGVVDVAAGGQVHDVVRTPAGGPDHLFDFFRHGGRDGGVADVGVDLHQEIAADDHRFGFRVVDIGRDDGAATSDFAAHEFRRDIIGDFGAKAFTVADQAITLGAADVFADGDIFHFRRDDAAAGISDLGDGLAGFGAQRVLHDVGEFGDVGLAAGHVGDAIVFGFHFAAGIAFHVAAGFHPGGAQGGQASGDIDGGGGIGVGAGCVIDAHRRLRGRGIERDFAHGDADIRVDGAGDMDLAAARQRPGGDRHFQLGVDIGHGRASFQ